jgi:hypothetical protein
MCTTNMFVCSTGSDGRGGDCNVSSQREDGVLQVTAWITSAIRDTNPDHPLREVYRAVVHTGTRDLLVSSAPHLFHRVRSTVVARIPCRSYLFCYHPITRRRTTLCRSSRNAAARRRSSLPPRKRSNSYKQRSTRMMTTSQTPCPSRLAWIASSICTALVEFQLSDTNARTTHR